MAIDHEAYLRSHGIDEGVIAAAAADGPAALRQLAQTVALLGSAPTFTPRQGWEIAGAPEGLARKLWQAMGFARLPDDVPALTRADIEALRIINEHVISAGVTEETALRFARVLGQSMSTVADALLSVLDEGASEMDTVPPVDRDDLLILATEVVNPVIERELVYLLRRHLHAGALRRRFARRAPGSESTIGFADVVSFTRLSGQLDPDDLADLVERFEATTSDAIAEAGGRVVKLIGDAVLFEFDDAETAVELALSLVEAFGGDQPELRVGLAHGPVIAQSGDVYGPTVNLASRLVGFARPGTVLVDEHVAERVIDERFVVKSLRRRDLKGIGPTSMAVVRRADRPG